MTAYILYITSYFEGRYGKEHAVSTGIRLYCMLHDKKKKNWDKARRLRKIAFFISLNKNIPFFLHGTDLLQKIRDDIL